jgi:hypothetical protein
MLDGSEGRLDSVNRSSKKVPSLYRQLFICQF